MRDVWIAAVVLLCMSVVSGAQKAVPGAAPPPARDAPPPVYDSAGRRDPFVSTVVTTPDVRAAAPRAQGAAGLAISEISVRGVIESQGIPIAMVQGPDKKTYLMHQGDKFFDGRIKAITAQGLVIVQEVSDPLSSVKQREIRKQLRSAEDVKP